MGKKYQQLSSEERAIIAALQAEGRKKSQIAAALGRPASTIGRELKRNSGRQIGDRAVYAQQQTQARRWRGSRLERDPALRQQVLDGLKKGWSPEPVCGWLERQQGRHVISPESIYRFIQAQITRHKDYRWRHYLPRAKSKRGLRGRKGGSAALHIQDRVSIAERPAAVEDRSLAGNWEADLMMF